MGLLGDNVTTVEQASSHVLAVAGVTLDHLVVGLEARHGDLVDRVGFVSSLVGGDDGGVGNQREVDTGVGDQVGLELVQVDVERTIETQGSGDGGDNLGNQAVQVLVAGALDSEVTAADVVDGLVVNHEAAVGVLQGGVGGQDGVVGLHDGGSVLRGGVNAEFQLGLLAVVNGETLHQESTETRTGTTTEGVENQETLETSTVVGNTADLVEDLVDHLLSDSVVTTGVVVGGILTTGDHVLGVEKAAVGAGTDLIDDIGLEVTVDGTGDIFALACCRPTQTSSECTSFRFSFLPLQSFQRTSLGEESAEAGVGVSLLALLGQVSIGLLSQMVGQSYQIPIGDSRGRHACHNSHIPECRARDSRAIEKRNDNVSLELPKSGSSHHYPCVFPIPLSSIVFPNPGNSLIVVNAFLPPSTSWRFGNQPGQLQSNENR